MQGQVRTMGGVHDLDLGMNVGTNRLLILLSVGCNGYPADCIMDTCVRLGCNLGQVYIDLGFLKSA